MQARAARPFFLSAMMLLVMLFILGRTTATYGQQTDELPSEFDPSGMIRFESLEQADQRRDELNRYIWPGGIPSTIPDVQTIEMPDAFAAIPADIVAGVERVTIDVGEFDFVATAYRIMPRIPRQPAMHCIVHAGHVRDGPDNYLSGGVDDTVVRLLELQCDVVIMQMPLVGWNDDRDGLLPDGTAFTIEGRGTNGHRLMFDHLEPQMKGGVFALFLEPVVQVVNLFQHDANEHDTICMIGLSGGGWTTHMAAAIDRRIDMSIPVAGAMPLYAREFSPGSRGDNEQFHEPLYREIDTNGDGIADTADGICSWLEVFALGALGSSDRPRTQIQVLNLYDSCCFSGTIYRSYDEFLVESVARHTAGKWSVFIDDSHRGHLISELTIDEVIAPLVNPWRD